VGACVGGCSFGVLCGKVSMVCSLFSVALFLLTRLSSFV